MTNVWFGLQDKVLLKVTPSAVIWSTLLRLWTGGRFSILICLDSQQLTVVDFTGRFTCRLLKRQNFIWEEFMTAFTLYFRSQNRIFGQEYKSYISVLKPNMTAGSLYLVAKW